MAAPTRTLDALTSATLKHVRDEWWDEAFTTFLVERLRPRSATESSMSAAAPGKSSPGWHGLRIRK